ncbi:hypothetical protein HELRODRAFT_190950 [Helobdella robusta]|uniref:Maspardin n=1 Tax=Helobdella robusta TaxID=6412 RepID=T1FSG3_HELRO|nr:hypothetical protein HELRODRAFT_190950 [Helobdella robusta]ESO08233.1 hypothetical protein HELRODRAFT_190950 [Helobdella robusta]
MSEHEFKNEEKILSKEHYWLLNSTADKTFQEVFCLLNAGRELTSPSGLPGLESSHSYERFILNGANGTKCIMTLDSCCIIEADLLLKVLKPSTNQIIVYRFKLDCQYPWIISQLQESSNYLNKGLQLLESILESTNHSSGYEIINMLDNLVTFLRKSKDLLANPSSSVSTATSSRASQTNVKLSPELPKDLDLTIVLQSPKLICTVYQLSTNQKAQTVMECLIPRLNDIILIISRAINLSQMLKDKVIVKFRIFTNVRTLRCAMSDFSKEYVSFRGNVPMKKICVQGSETWTIYDAGSKSIKSPIIFLPPVVGQADVYFKQILALSALGYRTISVEYPVLWTVRQFCISFNKLLDSLRLGKVHLFGSSVGGFLALKYAEYTKSSRRVHSVILCNSFTDASFFSSKSFSIPSDIYWLLPNLVLKKLVLSDLKRTKISRSIDESIEFMKASLDNLTQEELSSRLTLNCVNDYVQPQFLRHVKIMVIEVNDCEAVDSEVMNETFKCFPEAKKAELKNGGCFPFLCRSDEVNIFIQIHMKDFLDCPDCRPIEPNNPIMTLYVEANQSTSTETTS